MMTENGWNALFAKQLADLALRVESIEGLTGLLATGDRDRLQAAALGLFGTPGSEMFRKTALLYLEFDGIRSLGEIRNALSDEGISQQYTTALLRPLRKAKLGQLVHSSSKRYVYRRFAQDEFIGLSDALKSALKEG